MPKIELLSFNVAGVSFRPANLIDPLTNGEKIRLIAEPQNAYDSFAVRVECLFVKEKEDGSNTYVWEHIGYIPKKNTWIFHVLRKVGVPLSLTMLVNHDAPPQDKLLVRVFAEGDENRDFVNV